MNHHSIGQSMGGGFADFVFEIPLPANYVLATGTAILPFEVIKPYLSGRPLPKWYRPPGFDEGRRRSEPGPRGP